MVIAWIALVVAVAGALVYGLTNGKPSELGRLAFFAGLFVFVWHVGTATLRFGP